MRRRPDHAWEQHLLRHGRKMRRLIAAGQVMPMLRARSRAPWKKAR